MILGLARAVTGLARLDCEQHEAVAWLVQELPERATLNDVLRISRKSTRRTLTRLGDGLELLTRADATAHLFALPLERGVIQEVEVEAMLHHLEKRVAFDLECLERGVDPRPRGWA